MGEVILSLSHRLLKNEYFQNIRIEYMALKHFLPLRVFIAELFCILCGQKIVNSRFYNQTSHFMRVHFYSNKFLF